MSDLSKELKAEIRKREWIPGEQIGGGGGGIVFYAYRARLVEAFIDFHKEGGSLSLPFVTEHEMFSIRLIQRLYESMIQEKTMIAALKVPHLVLKRANPEKRKKVEKRLNREIEAMKSVNHPALIKLFDHDPTDPPKWFIMEYHPGGTLAGRVKQFKGQLLQVLSAIRPIIEGVSLLHQKEYIHRDIKPGNIFFDSSGKLVLGDLGIVFKKEIDQLTQAGEIEYSRDWAPDWVQHRDLDDYSKKVDVFMLCKVIYFMITGGQKVLVSQLDDDDFDLNKLFPNVPGMDDLYRLICSCVKHKELKCQLENAGALLTAVDEIISSLQGASNVQLLYNLSIGNLAIDRRRAIGNNFVHQTQVFIPRPAKGFGGKANIKFTGAPQTIHVRYRIDTEWSQSEMVGPLNSDSGWTGVMTLSPQERMKPGWYNLDIEAVTDGSDSAKLFDFILYFN